MRQNIGYCLDVGAGHQVVGAELSQIAIEDLFKSLHLTPSITHLGEITHYSATNIDVFVGDIFALTPAMVGKVDAIYDRAALVALPDEMRKRLQRAISGTHQPSTAITHLF